MRRALLLAGVGMLGATVARAETDPAAVLATYADIAHAMYDDALTGAEALQAAIADLTADPSEATLAAARDAWLAARVPYQQTEAYRFGNVLVDDWEGRVNAWPLDEGLIDYVDETVYGSESDENRLYSANVIANETLVFGGETIDASVITKELLADVLQEADNIEANVATGYHAIEFLLWGQDLNGTGPGAGARPHTDFDTDACTGGHCERRVAYLETAADLLVDDLDEMVALWADGGEARLAVTEVPPEQGLTAIVTGLGSLSYGELAGERMQLGLMLHDPEEEHDCFSDNTHNSHAYDQRGMVAVYTGLYERTDGTVVSGPSLSDLVAEADPALDEAVRAALDATTVAMAAMVATAEGGMAYDQMIGEGNTEGNQIVQTVIDRLVDQAHGFEQVAQALDLSLIEFEGSDSLDNPDAVFE
ncbi:MAG: peptidase [Rhodospirillaceae bacterium]|nr:peptidase [Rhodospirillaceae bacterium]